ncbi:MAG TPA: O-antigen ligase family protein [Candidatus Polarisedimenticolia bacterium]|jgi:O-antigen ligase|nr:O-antigen ligase family protein [Candidatus Polarisedimenticolia bacterium]
MSTLRRDMSRPIMMLIVLGYLTLLAVGLIRMHLDPDVVAALTIGGIGLVILALRPYLGIHAFIAVMYLENVLPSEGGVTGPKVLGAVILTGWLLSAALRRGLGFRLGAFVLVMLAFVTWTGVSSVYALDDELALARVFSFVQLAGATLMFISVIDRPSRMRGVQWAIVLWTCLATIFALAEYYLGLTNVAVGFIGNRNGLASGISFAIVFACLLYQADPGRLARLFLIFTLPVFFLGLALTLSRTGFIMLAVGLLAVWYRVVRDKGLLILAGSVAALSLVTVLLPDTVWQRVGSIVPAIRQQRDTFGLRVRLWQAGMRMIEDRPVFGVGPGNFVAALPRYSPGELTGRQLVAHNSYVSVAAEMGLVGLALFLMMYLLALREAGFALRWGRRSGSKELELHAFAMEISLILVMTGALAGSLESLKYNWMCLGLAVGVGQVARQASSRAGAQLRGRAVGAVTEGAGGPNVEPRRLG